MGDILTISFFRNLCPKQWPLGFLCDVSIDIDMYIYTCWCMFILNIWAHTNIYIHIFEKDRLVFSVNCTVSLSPTVNSWYMHLCNWLFVALCIYIYTFLYHVLSACFFCHRNERDMASSAFAASGIQDKELFLGSNYWVVPYFSYVELIRGHMF